MSRADDTASSGARPQQAAPSHGGSGIGSGGGQSSAPVSHSSIEGVGSTAGESGRKRFAGDELAIVLSHFDIGVIQGIQEFPRGSRKAPKLKIKTDAGQYLLKRRARGKADPYKVAFAHALQLHLAARQFPLPQLIGTRRENNSMLQWNGAIYELFEYISGGGYDGSLEATDDAGRILALFHKLLRDFETDYETAKGSYHNARSVITALQTAPQTFDRMNAEGQTGNGQRTDEMIEFLHASYDDAAKRVDEAGLPDWPEQIIHSDWHPGNMLFRGSRVVAVIDYDAARFQQRIIDVANGALQFSILGGSEDPTQWPDSLDEGRFKRFLRAYDGMPECVLSRAELRAIPWLMIEALIAESVIPIAATGSFARHHGVDFLAMVERKVRWLQQQADHLVALAEE